MLGPGQYSANDVNLETENHCMGAKSKKIERMDFRLQNELFVRNPKDFCRRITQKD